MKWYVVWIENNRVDSIVLEYDKMSDAAAQCDKLNRYIPETSASGFDLYSEQSIDDEIRTAWEIEK